MQIWADVKSSAGVILGEGPLTNISAASVSRVLDGAGTVSITVPVGDPRVIDLVQNERQITIHAPYPSDDADGIVVGRLEYTGCTFSASGADASHPADDAFDFDLATYWQAAAGSPQWVQVTFTADQTVRGYTIARPSGATSGLPVNFTFQYWDGAAWQVADTQAGVTWTDTKHDYVLASAVTSAEFRLNITATIFGGNPKVNTLDITGDAPAVSLNDREVGTGIIRNLQGSLEGGAYNLTLSGPDELDSLKRVNTLLNRLYTNVDTGDALDDLIALAAGWSIDYTGITGTLYAKFDGVSVLKAIQDIATQTGYHFRLNSSQAVKFGALADDSGKRILQAGHALPQEAYANEDVLFIERLTWDERSDEIANWIVPLGKGEGEASITLARATRTGSLVEENTNYIGNGAGLIDSTYKTAQSFQLGATATINQAAIGLFRSGTGTSFETFTLRVETDSGGNPSGTLVDEGAVAILPESGITNSTAWYTFVFNGGFTLLDSTTYWLVLTTSGSNTPAAWEIGQAYTSGAPKQYDGTSWSGLGVNDLTFRLYAGDADTTIYSVTGPDGKPIYLLKNDASIAAYGQNERVVVFEGIAAQDNTDAAVIATADQLKEAALAWMADHLSPVVTYGCSVRNVRTNLLPGQTIPLVYRGLVYDTDGLTPIAFKDINDTFYITRVTENFSPNGDSTDLELSNVQRVKTSVAAQVASVLESSTIRAVASDPRIGYDPSTAGGRLTLTSATPVTTADVTAATVLYYTPFKHNWLTLWNNYRWMPYVFAEIPIALDGLAANTNFDVFAYDYNGVVVLETVAWTNATTRATALALQDGVYVKTGALTHKYLGTFRTTATAGQCEDSLVKRYVWNNYNRLWRRLFVVDTTNHSYNSATWRQWNATSGNMVKFVLGLLEEPVMAIIESSARAAAGGQIARVGFAFDATNTANQAVDNQNANITQCSATGLRYPAAVGYHYIAATQSGGASGSVYNAMSLQAMLRM